MSLFSIGKYSYESTPVKIVDKITFLGYQIDHKLNFGAQCDTLCNNIALRQRALSSFMSIKSTSHPVTLKLIADSIIMGYARYFMTIFPNAKKSHVKKIEPKITACLRHINGLLPTTPKNVTSAITSVPPMTYGLPDRERSPELHSENQAQKHIHLSMHANDVEKRNISPTRKQKRQNSDQRRRQLYGIRRYQ